MASTGVILRNACVRRAPCSPSARRPRTQPFVAVLAPAVPVRSTVTVRLVHDSSLERLDLIIESSFKTCFYPKLLFDVVRVAPAFTVVFRGTAAASQFSKFLSGSCVLSFEIPLILLTFAFKIALVSCSMAGQAISDRGSLVIDS